ncbi:MAG: homoserine O-acetyltransferase [Chlorobi bacterium]|nr:homoserine O-acetyltransferase [Chlorobiota bacterium]
MSGLQTLTPEELFPLEQGGVLPGIEIGYHTWGRLNARKDNVVWVCHALTANSDVKDWWPGMFGNGKLLDPENDFIVCANILGSCYGTTGPLSENPETGKPYFRSFPLITFRDVVRAHDLLRKHLGVEKIRMVIGGSIGGYQALEYSIMYPDLIENLIFLASATYTSPWAVAFNQSQRLAIEADPTFFLDIPDGGKKGLRTARSMALLSYRNDRIYNKTQRNATDEDVDHFRASSYQNYQGDKLAGRFNAYAYHLLTRLTDTHNVGRGRGGRKAALRKIKARVLAIGIISDLLYPVYEQKYLSRHTENGHYREIDSLYGHDGFLTDTEKLTPVIRDFLIKQPA